MKGSILIIDNGSGDVHRDGLAVDEEHVVGGAGVGGVFADGLALGLVEVDGVLRLNRPARGPQLRVDGVASDLFRVLVGRHRCACWRWSPK